MTLADYEQVHALWLKTHNLAINDADDSREGIAKYLERNPRTSFVAEADGKIAGVILCGHDGRRGYISHTAVAESAQNQGIGAALAEAATAALANEGIPKAALVAFERNVQGNAFWEKQGFKVRKDLVYRDKFLTKKQ